MSCIYYYSKEAMYQRSVNRCFGTLYVLLAILAILLWPTGFHGFSIEGFIKLLNFVLGMAVGFLGLMALLKLYLDALPNIIDWLKGY